MSKARVKSHLTYTVDQIEDIEVLASMCAYINGTLLEAVSAPIKLMFRTGTLRREDSEAWLTSCPFLMNIIVGGNNTNHANFKLRQMFYPISARNVCDAILNYEIVIRSEYTKLLKREIKLQTRTSLSGAIHSALTNELNNE